MISQLWSHDSYIASSASQLFKLKLKFITNTSGHYRNSDDTDVKDCRHMKNSAEQQLYSLDQNTRLMSLQLV